jgi:hypothetical protein
MGKVEKIKLNDGSIVDGEQVEISSSSEQWNQYVLEDGTLLKLKPVATKVVRLVNQYDQAGNPVYLIQSNNVVSMDCPEKLKKAN